MATIHVRSEAEVQNRGQSAPTCQPSAPPSAPQPDRRALLSESDLALVRQAAAGRKFITRATRIARISSVTTLVIAILAVPFAIIWPSWQGGLVTAGLCVIGAVEFAGYRRMRRGDPAAAKMLGLNQLAMLGLIVLYCLAQMLTFSPDQAKAAALSAEVRSQLGGMAKDIDAQIERLAPLVTYGIYGLIIILSAVFQGGLARYYFSRRRYMEAFNAHTPPWILQILAETSA